MFVQGLAVAYRRTVQDFIAVLRLFPVLVFVAVL